MLAKQNQKQIKNKLNDVIAKVSGTDFSMSDSMNRTENVTDESAMDLAGADEGDSIINHSH